MSNPQKLGIAKKLKELREASHLTQKDISEITNKAVTTIASWESGKGQPDVDTLFRLLAYYHVENVLEEFGYKEKTDTFSLAEREHINVIRNLEPRTVDLVYHTANELCVIENGRHQSLKMVARKGSKSPCTMPQVIAMLPDEGWGGKK